MQKCHYTFLYFLIMLSFSSVNIFTATLGSASPAPNRAGYCYLLVYLFSDWLDCFSEIYFPSHSVMAYDVAPQEDISLDLPKVTQDDSGLSRTLPLFPWSHPTVKLQ